LAERNFASWFDSAGKFWCGSRDYGARLWLKEAAFLLHQATERYYHSAILVFTGYKKIATFCGANAMRKDLPTVPQMGAAVLANLSPPPTDPQEFGQWAQNLAELSEQRVQAERQQARAEGLVEGKTEGRAEGFHAGEALGEAKALLMVLRSRDVEVSAELEERIMACADPTLLAKWLQRVATVASAAELLAG
jgi:hypothetical protein